LISRMRVSINLALCDLVASLRDLLSPLTKLFKG